VYNAAFMDTSMYHASFDRFLEALTLPDAEVLELGCGPGNITRYLLAQRAELRVLGTDLAPRMLELARTNNPGATFELLDARQIIRLDRSFDAIVCGYCLPYLTPEECRTLVRDASQLLRPEGVLYLSTIEGDPARSGFKTPSSGTGEAAYIQYYETGFLTRLIEGHGFSILHIEHVRYSGRDGNPTTDVIIVARRSGTPGG
jgi:2-polyprenyl-3-methyl-5-hydroxy-6-metoxy-1,4-benzoquinol methylase